MAVNDNPRTTTIVRNIGGIKDTSITRFIPLRTSLFTANGISETEVSVTKVTEFLRSMVRQLNELTEAIDRAIQPLSTDPKFNGKVVFKDVQFTAAQVTQITHGLQRKYSGWQIFRVRTANANVFELPPLAVNDDILFLRLQAGTTFIADVEVW